MKTQLLKLSAFLIAVTLLVSLLPIQPVSAANGDLVGTITFAQDCASGLGVGIAFDGTNLWFSCYASTTDLYKANATTGAILASFQVRGGLGALAWDSTRGKLWAGSGCGPGQTGAEIYLIDPGTGTSSLQFSIPNFSGNCLDDGLAYDATNDTIYHSWDGAQNIRHLSTIGTPQSDDNFTWGGSGCYNSGLAIGGNLLYQGSDGCNRVWVVDKVTKTAAFNFSTVIAGDPNFRDEGLTCDTNTFASQGKHVMWSKEAYSPNRASAFEIPFGTCGVGGNPALNDYKQNKKADGTYEAWAPDPMYDIATCDNMSNIGCAVTSLTDILTSYALTTLPNGAATDPGTLNHFLGTKAYTHTGCYIIWSTAGQATGFTIHDYRPPSTSYDDRIARINEALQANNLVIIGIPQGGGKHFMVLYATAPNAADGSPDYLIVDPYRYKPYATTGNRSGKPLSVAYGKTLKQMAAQFQIEVVDNKSPLPGRSWAIVAHSPVEMLITDPNGAQTGFNPASNTYLLNIPDSSYGEGDDIVGDDDNNTVLPPVLYFGQNGLENGQYKIEVFGTGTGPYTLDIAVANGQTDGSIRSIVGNAQPGSKDTYIVISVDGQPLALLLQINIDIKPGQTTNPISLKSAGLTPVAILSTSTFNASTVDLLSLRFGPAEASASQYSWQDVNNDGLTDLVLQFKTKQTGIKIGDTEACITGKTQTGLDVQGCDKIRVTK